MRLFYNQFFTFAPGVKRSLGTGPFEDISDKVVNAPVVRAGFAPNRLWLVSRFVHHGTLCVVLIPPRIKILFCTVSRGIFPFGFGGQPIG